MKIFGKSGWLINGIFFLILVTGSVTVNAEEKIYTLGFSPGSQYHAIVRDRMKLVYERAGLKAKFIGMPHKRSVSSANRGLIDGDVGRNPNVEKKFKNLLRIRPQVSESLGSAYTISSKITSYDLDQLKNYSVGYVSGVRWVLKRLEGVDAVTVKTYPQLAKMLLNGRIDIAVGTELSMDAAIKSLKEDTSLIHKLNPKANRSPTFHFVHKSNADIIPKLEKALKELIQEKGW